MADLSEVVNNADHWGLDEFIQYLRDANVDEVKFTVVQDYTTLIMVDSKGNASVHRINRERHGFAFFELPTQSS